MTQIKFQLPGIASRNAFLASLMFAAFVSTAAIVHSLGNSTPPNKLLSVNSSGTSSANNGGDIVSISANGRYVLFVSSSTDLVPLIDNNGNSPDVFVRDTQTNTTTLVSVNFAGTGSAGSMSQTPSMSRDGRYVTFSSAAPDLVRVNPGINGDVYLRDLQAGTTRLVSVSTVTNRGGNLESVRSDVSADGRFVAFQSRAYNLGPIDNNGVEDIYVRDMQANTTVLASINTTGTDSGDAVSGPSSPFFESGFSITPDGRYVVFLSRASNLVSLPDLNFGASDIFVRDLQAGTTSLVSVNIAGTGTGNTHSANPNITPDGRHIIFISLATNLTTIDANGPIRDVFIRDMQAGVTSIVSLNSAGASGNFDSPASGESASVSADGRFVAFQSGASNLFPNDNNGTTDVFVRDVQAGVTYLASINSAGTASSNNLSTGPVISEDGRFVAFVSFSSNLTTIPDTNGSRDIYLRDIRTGKTALASINASGTAAGNNETANVRMSKSGRYLALTSFSSDLTTTTDLNNNGDAFLFHNRAKGGAPGDFDGDGITDLSVFRPANSTWYILQSSNDAFVARQFGLGTDQLVPGDYDGDGKTDLAVFRNGDWFVLQSSNGFVLHRHFGSAGDIPAPADYDNDDKTDFSVFSPLASTWYIERSSDLVQVVRTIGGSGDLPVPGDYDGDGSADIAVWRPSTGTWYSILTPGTNVDATQFGMSGDKPVQADYDADGKTDLAVYRANEGTWYVLTSTAGLRAEQFGLTTDIVVPADYDGDGYADKAVFRDGDWYIRTSNPETPDLNAHWGQLNDKPVPAAYIPGQ